jgi:RNA polymerase sigma-70 factor (ECF subfamily)
VSRESAVHTCGDQTRALIGLHSVAWSNELPQHARTLQCSTRFEEIYKRFHSRIQRLALRITRNPEDAEDVVQECFMRAFVHLNTFSGRSKLSTWISRIGINVALMKIRSRRRYEFSLDAILECPWAGRCAELVSDQPAPDQRLRQTELEQILAAELAQLSPSLSRVVDLHYFAELPARECAQILGISLSNAKAQLFRAKRKLRPAFERRFRRPIISFRLGCCR